MITDRIDEVTNISTVLLTTHLPAPKSVKVELTAACDFRCWFCATGKNLRPKSHMDFEDFKRYAKELRADGVEKLGLFYLGESFLYKQLPEAIEFAKKECGFPWVFLTTNGRMATKERVKMCMEAGLDSLKFSLNWANRQQCIDDAGVDAFDVILNNVAAARATRDRVEQETGYFCELSASSIKYDGEQEAQLADVIETIRPFVDEHYYLPLFSQKTLITGDAEGRGYRPRAGNIGRIGGEVDPLPCWVVFKETFITFNGDVAACCFSHDKDFVMGNMKDNSFMEIWNSAGFQNLRTAHINKDVTGTPCENCAAYK